MAGLSSSRPPWARSPPLAGPSRSCRHVARLSPLLALRLFRTRSPPDRFRSLWLPPNGSLTSLSPGLRLLPNLIPLALLHVGGPYSGTIPHIIRDPTAMPLPPLDSPFLFSIRRHFTLHRKSIDLQFHLFPWSTLVLN